MATAITISELRNRIDEGTKPYVIDVRRKADYEKSPEMITGASWKDPEKVEEWGAKLPPGQEVIVYCVKGGSVSQSVADALENSHPYVRFLDGGILKWQDWQKLTFK
jgi:rhodanese-related sulfurtransferase